MELQRRIYEILEKGDINDKISKRFDAFIMSLIVLNVTAVIMETVESIHNELELEFYYFELISIIIFSIEYLGRLWTCTCADKYKHPVWGRLKYILSVAGLIDLIAILPFYLPLLFVMDGRVIRMLRLFRLLRVFKMGRYSKAFKLIINVVRKRKEELFITLTFILVLLIVASSLMYFLENEAQPEHFGSIPETMWWGVATLTTVGYGDVYPITPVGKLLGAFIAVLGVGVFALPAGIIASGFEADLKEKVDKNDEEED